MAQKRGSIVAMRAFVLVALLLLSGCTPVQFANSLVSRDLQVSRDVAYGPLPRHRLDLYRFGGNPDVRGAVLFLHGGYWDSGDKRDYPFLADTLAEQGYLVAVANYRLVPEASFPAFVQDAALALRWLAENAGAEPLFVMGHSAGAHIGALLVYDERFLSEVGLEPDAVAGFIGLAGPYDFLPLAPDDARARAALGDEPGPDTQPITFVDGSEAPALLLVGEADTTVDPANSLRLAERIRARGGAVTLERYAGLGHVELLGALARAGRSLAPRVLEDVLAFLEQPD